VGFAAAAPFAIAACVGDDPGTGGNVTDAGGDGGGSDAPITSGDGAVEACSGTICDSKCVDLKSDPNNCGTCGNACKSDAGVGFACVNSVCGNKVTQVSAGGFASCVLLLDGSVWCWGDQSYGQTGTVSANLTPVPQKVAGISNAVEVFAGWATVCARDASGDVWCWGYDGNGEAGQPLGDGGSNVSGTPKKVPLPDKAAQLAGGTSTMCARTVAGNIFCWGQNSSDLLGLGADVTQIATTPVQIPIFSSDAIGVQIGISDNGLPGIHAVACGVRTDKTLWCWGSNIYGELGHAVAGGSPADIGCSNTTEGYNCNPIPQLVEDVDAGGFGNVVAVRPFNAGSCALRGDGTIWCWGQNGDAELGAGTIDQGAHPIPSLALTNGAQLAASDLSILALDTGGAVHGWGATFNGVLPLGDYSGTACYYNFACKESAVSVPLLPNIAQISLSYDHGLALTKSGGVLAWGDNNSEELGHDAGSGGDSVCPIGGGICNPTPASPLVLPWQ
jgi:alpha-tubulin suppressor-like RCC1 family protein